MQRDQAIAVARGDRPAPKEGIVRSGAHTIARPVIATISGPTSGAALLICCGVVPNQDGAATNNR